MREAARLVDASGIARIEALLVQQRDAAASGDLARFYALDEAEKREAQQ